MTLAACLPIFREKKTQTGYLLYRQCCQGRTAAKRLLRYFQHWNRCQESKTTPGGGQERPLPNKHTRGDRRDNPTHGGAATQQSGTLASKKQLHGSGSNGSRDGHDDAHQGAQQHRQQEGGTATQRQDGSGTGVPAAPTHFLLPARPIPGHRRRRPPITAGYCTRTGEGRSYFHDDERTHTNCIAVPFTHRGIVRQPAGGGAKESLTNRGRATPTALQCFLPPKNFTREGVRRTSRGGGTRGLAKATRDRPAPHGANIFSTWQRQRLTARRRD